MTRHRDAVIKNRDALWRDALETAGLNFGCGTGQGDDLIRGAVSAIQQLQRDALEQHNAALVAQKRLRELATEIGRACGFNEQVAEDCHRWDASDLGARIRDLRRLVEERRREFEQHKHRTCDALLKLLR